MKPSSSTGMRFCRALRIAPVIAAISRPPRHCSISSGSVPAWRLSPARTAVVFRARPASSTPVPRPTQSSAMPPNRAQARAAAEVVLPMPISPRISRSVPGVMAVQPAFRAASRSASSIALIRVKSPVGRSSSSATTDSVAPKVFASWLIAAPPC